jgi:hypothetical protein
MQQMIRMSHERESRHNAPTSESSS